jgi:hypothetical protein
MRDDLNIDLMFPIRDNVSAGLMCVKAELLYNAAIINASELSVVIERAASMIDNSGRPSGTRPDRAESVSSYANRFATTQRSPNWAGVGIPLPSHASNMRQQHNRT